MGNNVRVDINVVHLPAMLMRCLQHSLINLYCMGLQKGRVGRSLVKKKASYPLILLQTVPLCGHNNDTQFMQSPQIMMS